MPKKSLVKELSVEIEGLNEQIKELNQDIKDLLHIANDFAPVYRCYYCNRYTREGYICVHCKTDNSTGECYDEEE